MNKYNVKEVFTDGILGELREKVDQLGIEREVERLLVDGVLVTIVFATVENISRIQRIGKSLVLDPETMYLDDTVIRPKMRSKKEYDMVRAYADFRVDYFLHKKI